MHLSGDKYVNCCASYICDVAPSNEWLGPSCLQYTHLLDESSPWPSWQIARVSCFRIADCLCDLQTEGASGPPHHPRLSCLPAGFVHINEMDLCQCAFQVAHARMPVFPMCRSHVYAGSQALPHLGRLLMHVAQNVLHSPLWTSWLEHCFFKTPGEHTLFLPKLMPTWASS